MACLHGSRLRQYSCDDTANLRDLARIAAPIEYLQEGQLQTLEDQAQLDSEEEEELLSLPTDQLVALIKEKQREIKTLRSELSKKNSLLSYFNTEDLATKRDAVATVLQFIDNIQAVKTSTDSLEVTSTASTARADLIDDEWQKKINTHSQGGVQAKNWWASDKPRPLCSSHIESPVPENRGPHTVLTATTQQQGNPVSRNTPSEHNAAQQHNTANTQQNNVPPQQPRRPSQPRRRPSQQQQLHSSSQRPQSQPQRSHKERRNTGTNTNRQVSFCQHCKTKGHTQNDCRKKQHCNFCKRQGHLEQDCRTKLSEERQIRLMRTLSAEQAQNNALLFQIIQRQLNFQPYQNPGHMPHNGWLGYNVRHQQNQQNLGPPVHSLG